MAFSSAHPCPEEFPVRDLTTFDFERLKQAHKVLPIGYDNDFFVKVCSKGDLHFGLCTEGRHLDSTLAGFVTARRALTKYMPVSDTTQLVYVLTIGVDPDCRRRRLAHTLMHGIIQEAQRRKCAAVMLHTPTNNVAACGLYSALGFSRLRKHLSFYSIPSSSPGPSSHAVPIAPAPVHLDAYLFCRSTNTPVTSQHLESTGSHISSIAISPAPQSRANVCLPVPPPQSMHQSRQDCENRDDVMHAAHAHIHDPAPEASQLSLLADVGFSGALVRSTEAAGMVLGMVSSWLGNSCSARYAASHPAYTAASPPPIDAQHPQHAAACAGHAAGATCRAVRRPAASAMELRSCDDGDGSCSSTSAVPFGGHVHPISQRLLPDGSKGAVLEEMEPSTAPSSNTSCGWCQDGHDAGGSTVRSNAGSIVVAVGCRAQQHVSAAADLTFFQRVFGRP